MACRCLRLNANHHNDFPAQATFLLNPPHRHNQSDCHLNQSRGDRESKWRCDYGDSLPQPPGMLSRCRQQLQCPYRNIFFHREYFVAPPRLFSENPFPGGPAANQNFFVVRSGIIRVPDRLFSTAGFGPLCCLPKSFRQNTVGQPPFRFQQWQPFPTSSESKMRFSLFHLFS